MTGFTCEQVGSNLCVQGMLPLEPFWNTDRRSYGDITPQGEVLEYAKHAAIAMGLIE